MGKVIVDIKSAVESGGVWGVVRHVLRWLRLVDDELAPLARALAVSFACLPVAYLLLLWGNREGYAYIGFAGAVAILIAEAIWIILIGIIGWKLLKAVISDCRSGRLGRPGKDKTETQ